MNSTWQAGKESKKVLTSGSVAALTRNNHVKAVGPATIADTSSYTSRLDMASLLGWHLLGRSMGSGRWAGNIHT
jgi:hypothetical protein